MTALSPAAYAIGLSSIATIGLLLAYADQLGDGNVERLEREARAAEARDILSRMENRRIS